MNKQIKFIDLGVMDYKDAWDYQQKLFDEIVEIKKKNRKNNSELITPNYFLFVEHPHVYTLGKSGKMSNLLIDENQLKSKNASFYKINSCLLYTSPSPRDRTRSRMPSSA